MDCISIKNVSMEFYLAEEQFSGLKDFVIMATKRRLKFKKFCALKNINLEIKKGESWALIGENGCGKSTLLKVISGIYKPTKGVVRVNGSIAPLIELGAGFDSELTARENIYLNGAVLGHSKKVMNQYFDEIIEFSELKDFLDVPIKNFSSGMVARLGFAIATAIKADIIIIDEILAVGDYAFQQKCYKRMEEMKKNGTTIIFVSHDEDQVRSMCKNAVWISHGEIQAIGETKDVCDLYKEYITNK
ncbi:MAG: ABC transporter ATP-binding protein [Veillonella sp.]|uniref:ABC transporter ATP-binding protein n=1 Tax=Veillonella sp. TaxID=1926307 RepID=UPI0025D0904C|nr:ABC transporter ATP-binding protein [Veillonella sp.]MBS4913646.1 ABC transporter ATP-binding protein [Veillonella sp.]